MTSLLTFVNIGIDFICGVFVSAGTTLHRRGTPVPSISPFQVPNERDQGDPAMPRNIGRPAPNLVSAVTDPPAAISPNNMEKKFTSSHPRDG